LLIQRWRDDARGVEVRPAGYANEVTIIYNGLLAKSGCDQVYLHYGFGDPMHWHNVCTQKMDRTGAGWEKTIRLSENKAMICFKDSAANWDNNSGHNWIVQS